MNFTEDLPLLVPGHMMIYGDPRGATQAINIPFVKYVAGDKLHITRIDTVYLVLSTTYLLPIHVWDSFLSKDHSSIRWCLNS